MSETTHDENEGLSTAEAIKYSLLGFLVLGGTFFVGRSLVRRARADNEEKKTYVEGAEATFAKKIKMAFDNDMAFGWGTDEEKLRGIIRAIPSQDAFGRVVNSYQKLYNRSMMRDMQEELSTTEYNEMLAIIAAKPKSGSTLLPPALSPVQYLSWAKRLKAAFDITYGWFPGTDNDAIKAVFMEIPTQAAYKQVGQYYEKEYGSNLQKDLNSELEFWEKGPMMEIINKKPKT
jgi:hypothetical protein